MVKTEENKLFQMRIMREKDLVSVKRIKSSRILEPKIELYIDRSLLLTPKPDRPESNL